MSKDNKGKECLRESVNSLELPLAHGETLQDNVWILLHKLVAIVKEYLLHFSGGAYTV